MSKHSGDRCRQMCPRPDGSFWVCSFTKNHSAAHSWADKPTEIWGYQHRHLAIDEMAVIVEALQASYNIGECGDHPKHLIDAERKARRALDLLVGGGK